MYRILLVQELEAMKLWQKNPTDQISHEFLSRHIHSWVTDSGTWGDHFLIVDELKFRFFLTQLYELLLLDHHAVILHNLLNDKLPVTREKLHEMDTSIRKMMVHDWNRCMLRHSSIFPCPTVYLNPATFHPQDTAKLPASYRLLFTSFHTISELFTVFHRYITLALTACK